MKKKIVVCLSMLAVFAACVFLCPVRTEARERAVQTRICSAYEQALKADDIPAEITEPVEKGKHLIVYLIIAFGAVCALVGGVLLGIAFLGHQQDMQARGFIFFFVGILIVLLPVIINWMVPKANLL